MYKKLIFLICCLTAIHLTASENELTKKVSQNANRYQMKVIATGGYDRYAEIYVLDKETGTIWRTGQDVWEKRGTYDPWVQPPPFPL